METYAGAEKLFHGRFKFRARSNPHLVGEFDDGFALTCAKHVEKNDGSPRVVEQSVAQPHQLCRGHVGFAHVKMNLLAVTVDLAVGKTVFSILRLVSITSGL